MATPASGVVSLLDADAELGAGVPEQEWDAARHATAGPSLSLEPGPIGGIDRFADNLEVLGLVVLSGLLVREVTIDHRGLPELLGRGDVIEPWVDGGSIIPSNVELSALLPSRLLVLGPRFARAAARWPTLLGALQRRLALQRQRLAVHGALLQLSRVELRVLALLWHLAATWGRVVPEGVIVPFALTHEMLGRFVGAQRPTVTLAVRELNDEGRLERAPDGSWLLVKGSDEYLRKVLETDGGAPSPVGRARLILREARDIQRG